MLNYFIRRTIYSLWVIIGVLALTFILFNLASGDPAAAVLGKDARPEEIDRLRRDLGSDLPLFFGKKCQTEAWKIAGQPENGTVFIRNYRQNGVIAELTLPSGNTRTIHLPDDTDRMEIPEKISRADFYRLQENPFNSQFIKSLSEVVSFSRQAPYIHFFNFGRTISTGEPVKAILKRCILPSLSLMIPVFIGELLFGILLALISCAWQNRWPDRLLMLLAVSGMSISYLVVIIFGQWFFGYRLNWFPLWGYGQISQLGLPVLIGIICGVGANVRFFRTVFADEIKKEYLRTAAAKGLPRSRVLSHHLLRNAAMQIITKASAGLPFLFTGSLLLESFFGVPGLGFAGVDALYNSDIQLLKAIVVMSALLFVVINLLADLAYAWADPRICLE